MMTEGTTPGTARGPKVTAHGKPPMDVEHEAHLRSGSTYAEEALEETVVCFGAD